VSRPHGELDGGALMRPLAELVAAGHRVALDQVMLLGMERSHVHLSKG